MEDTSDMDHIQTNNIFPLSAKKVQVWRTYQDTCSQARPWHFSPLRTSICQ